MSYAVIFEVTPKPEGSAQYLEIAGKLKEHLKDVEGFLSIERLQSLENEGKILSLSFWESEEAMQTWRNTSQHRAGQKSGHDNLFQNYRIRVANISRDYTHEKRTEAPIDSNIFHSL